MWAEIPDYAIAGKTAIVIPPKDSQSLAEEILQLVENEEKLKSIALAGYQHIQNFTWEKASEKFEQALLKED
jgi:glycosyltransferase involved in cell wall biosynthesis